MAVSVYKYDKRLTIDDIRNDEDLFHFTQQNDCTVRRSPTPTSYRTEYMVNHNDTTLVRLVDDRNWTPDEKIELSKKMLRAMISMDSVVEYCKYDVEVTQMMMYKSMANSLYGGARFQRRCLPIPSIKKVIFNDPATIVIWADDTKTVVKAGDELFDPEKGLAMAISKKALGNEGNYFNEFKKWLPEDYEDIIRDDERAASMMVFGLLKSMGEKMELCEKAYDSLVKLGNVSKDAEDALVYLKLILNK